MLTHPLTETAQMRPLEPWNAEEFQASIERHRAHWAPWLPWAKNLTDVEATREWLRRYAVQHSEDKGNIYGIWLEGELVGGTLFRVFEPRFGLAEIGVWLAPQAGGRGLITKAAQRMIEWCFEERGFHRVEWHCFPDNTRSIAVAQRLGMKLDGVLRELFPYNDIRNDIQVWSLLAGEWKAVKPE